MMMAWSSRVASSCWTLQAYCTGPHRIVVVVLLAGSQFPLDWLGMLMPGTGDGASASFLSQSPAQPSKNAGWTNEWFTPCCCRICIAAGRKP